MTLDEMKQRLLAQREALLQVAQSGNEAAATVTLDQARVGRLSRMDALAQQAVAQATAGRRLLTLRQIEAALARIETDVFGRCLECDEPISAGRLAANPAVTLCINCAEQAESR